MIFLYGRGVWCNGDFSGEPGEGWLDSWEDGSITRELLFFLSFTEGSFCSNALDHFFEEGIHDIEFIKNFHIKYFTYSLYSSIWVFSIVLLLCILISVVIHDQAVNLFSTPRELVYVFTTGYFFPSTKWKSRNIFNIFTSCLSAMLSIRGHESSFSLGIRSRLCPVVYSKWMKTASNISYRWVLEIMH